MGLTIKGQRIPDVAEPLHCVPASGGLLAEGRSGGPRLLPPEHGGQREAARRRGGDRGGLAASRPPATRTRRFAAGLEEAEHPLHPRSQGGIWSSEPASPQQCHLPQGRLACRSLAGKEPGRCWLCSVSVYAMSVLVVAGQGARRRRTCLTRVGPPSTPRMPSVQLSRK